jgi:hypothetical protein
VNRRKTTGGWGATPPPPAFGERATPDLEVASLEELAALRQSSQPTGAHS